MGKPLLGDPRQSTFAWTDPAEVLDSADGRGEVVFEAPGLSRLTRVRPGRRLAAAARREIESFGLPFGVDGSGTCWSCGAEIDEAVRAGPGYATCPGCGAKLPFAE